MKRQATREVGCTGKSALTATVAKKVAREIRERGDKVVPYRCQHCHSWHVGGTVGKKATRGRPRREEIAEE